MNQTLEMTIRSAPPWLLITLGILAVVLLLGAGPFAGWCLERKRTAPAREAYRAGSSRWIETGEIDLEELRAEKAKRYRLRFAQEVKVIEERGLSAYARATEPDPVIVIRDDRPTEALAIAKPSWAEESTSAWSALEYVEEVHDGVVVEEPVLTEAERQFYADPLGSWVLPPEVEPQYDYLPTADEAVSFLIRADLLTGIGLDIDAEWQAWNLYEGANA